MSKSISGTDRMHVLYIMGQDSGGLPHYTAELANAVSAYADVTVLKPTETTADDILDPSVRVINAFKPTDISMQAIFDLDLNVRKNLLALLSFRNIGIINEIDPDIVHDPTDEFPHVSFFAYLQKVHEGRKYVVTSHESSNGGAGRLLRVADFIISAVPDFYKDAVIVHSEQQSEALQTQRRNAGVIQTIPHGVYSFFKDLEYEEQEEQDNHVLFFGSLIPPKGLEFLIKAVPSIVDEIPDFTLTIAGSGQINSECDHILRTYDDHITVRNEFIPNDEVGELFTRAQAVVLPYREGWQTGHSGTLSTAFAFGKPVITTAVGDFDRLVGGSGAGLVVEPENPKAIAEATVQLLTDDSQRQEMARASLRLSKELSWDEIGKQHMDLYRQLLGQKRVHLTA